MQFNLYRIEGKKVNRIGKLPKIDQCEIVGKKPRISNPIVKTLITVLHTFYDVPDPCPFVGYYQVANFSLNNKALFILPRGIIRFTLHEWTHDDEMLLALSILLEIED